MGACSSQVARSDIEVLLTEQDGLDILCDADCAASPCVGKPFLSTEDAALKFDEVFEFDRHSKLGEGGYASVFRATYRKSKQDVAVKMFSRVHPEFNFRRVQTEADLLCRMNHPNVVRAWHLYAEARECFIVMDLCAGADLFDKLSAAKKFDEPTSARVMRQVFEAISYIHSQGVCHRDVKLENFAFLNSGPIEDNTLKLLDFGFAISFSVSDPQFTDQELCTLQYSAPEIFNESRYGPKVDEWACGIIMYTMLVGSMPFEGSTYALLQQVKAAEFDLDGPHWQDVSVEAMALIQSLLTKNVRKRCIASDALQHAWVQRY